MNILVVNPNSSTSMNEVIFQAANQAAQQTSGASKEYTNISIIGLSKAPALINSALDETLASYYLIEKIKEICHSYDGFIVACHSDPGVLALRELTRKPVLGIGYASIYSSLLYGENITILAISEKSIVRKQKMLKNYGFDNRNFSIMPTGFNEEMSLAEAKEKLLQAGRKAKAEFHSDVLVLGCAGMAVLADGLAKELRIPVIDGVAVAVNLLENMIKTNNQWKE